MSALLLERESLRLRLDAARRRRASAAAQLALLRQKRALVVDEVLLLFRSKATLDGVRPRGGASAVATCPADASLAAAAQHGDARCRDAIVRALLVYANSWTLARTPEEEVDYRMIAARHAAVLDAAENALAQWQSLIKVPIDQLVSYHSGGVRPADVAALLSALGLGALAATNH